MHKSESTFCKIPFNHINSSPNGHYKLCCAGYPVILHKGEYFSILEVGIEEMWNHEYYKTLACRRGVPMGDLRQRALSLSRQIENLHVLDRKTVRINNIIFAGATFWSAIEAGGHYPEYIRRSLNVDKRTYRALHSRDAKWILRIINSVGKNDDEKLAIITHYPPSMKTLRTLGTKNEEFYASNREDLLKKNVGVWIYGHTHHNKDFMVNGIRLVSNQKGKKYDRCALCPCKVIEL